MLALALTVVMVVSRRGVVLLDDSVVVGHARLYVVDVDQKWFTPGLS